MRGVSGAAGVPAAPLQLAQASPGQPAAIREEVGELRAASRAVLQDLAGAELVVIVAAGDRGIHDQAHASLAPLGVADAAVDLPAAEEVVEHLSRLSQYPVFRGDPLDVDHSVLALLIHETLGNVPVVPVSVPAATDFDVLVSVGAGVVEALRDADGLGGVVVAADLSAGLHEGSPAHAIPGARDWERRARASAEAGDLKGLRDLGPEAAGQVRARGWAPLAVLHGVCATARLRPKLLGYFAPRGVGGLVVRCDGGAAAAERYERPDGDDHEGVVPRTGDGRG